MELQRRRPSGRDMALLSGSSPLYSSAPLHYNTIKARLDRAEEVKGRAFGSPLARALYSRASRAEVDSRAEPAAPAAVEEAAMKKFVLSAAGIGLFLATALAQAPAEVRVLWTFPGPGNPAYEYVTMAAAGNGLVYGVVKGKSWDFSTENGSFTETGSAVVALDAATGRLKWSAESRWPVLSPLLLAGGRLVAHNGYGEVLCFDAAGGKLLWKAERELHPGSWDERTMPSARGEFLFLREENEIVCRGLKDGRPVWRTPIEAVQNRRVFPLLVGNWIIVANAMDAVLGLDSRDGKIGWKKKLEWSDEISIAGTSVALASNTDRVAAFSIADGKDLGAPGGTAGSLENAKPLAVKNETVFLLQKPAAPAAGGASAAEVAAYNLTAPNQPLWRELVGDGFQGLSIAGPFVLIVRGGTVQARRAEDGKIAWQFDIPGEKALQGQALAVDGKIFVAGEKGLVCLETGDPRITGWSQSGGGAERSSGVR